MTLNVEGPNWHEPFLTDVASLLQPGVRGIDKIGDSLFEPVGPSMAMVTVDVSVQVWDICEVQGRLTCPLLWSERGHANSQFIVDEVALSSLVSAYGKLFSGKPKQSFFSKSSWGLNIDFKTLLGS